MVVVSGEEGKKRAKLCLKRMKSKPQGRAAVLLCYQQGNEWLLCANRIVLQNAK